MSSDIEWLKSKVSMLKSLTDKLCRISNIHYEAHDWTVLKLIALQYWVDVYTKIIPRYKRNYWYLDLLAGSGTNYIKETGDIVVGSSIIAYLFAHQPFSKYILIELDKTRCKALRRRLISLGIKNLEIYPDNCNRVIEGLNIDVDHYLAFIDCQGLDVKWKIMEKLLRKPGDIILLFQTMEIRRTLGRAKELGMEKALTDFYGDKSWIQAKNEKDLLEIYVNKLRKYRSYVNNIKIRGEGFHYDIILACKKGKYIRAWEHLKSRIEHMTSKAVRYALMMLKGELKGLEFFTRESLNKWL